jgi:hypothetical protein
MDEATSTHHCRGTKIIPFSMHNVDEVLDDLGLNISPLVRAVHWLGPINPAAYRRLTPTLLTRLAAGSPRHSPSAAPDNRDQLQSNTAR